MLAEAPASRVRLPPTAQLPTRAGPTLSAEPATCVGPSDGAALPAGDVPGGGELSVELGLPAEVGASAGPGVSAELGPGVEVGPEAGAGSSLGLRLVVELGSAVGLGSASASAGAASLVGPVRGAGARGELDGLAAG
ncbi:hypothetical protein H8N01_03060 [Streptomyces sp. AC536]|nr:hypothetical protein [Streptomyces buecherae]MBC3981575.1 hypothetical protein [Streptomyces buecherae]